MYQFVIALQYVGILILVIELFYILAQKPSRGQLLLALVIISTFINSAGYLLEIKSTTLEAAINCTRMLYLGKPFVSLAFFLFMTDYLKIRIPKGVVMALMAVHTLIFAAAFTCELHPLYYTNISYTNEGLFPHLILSHGPIYYVYMTLLFFYNAAMFIMCIRRFKKVKSKHERKRVVYLFLILAVPTICLIWYSLGITKGYDTTAVGSIISTLMLMRLFVSHNLFNTLSFAKDYMMNILDDGLAVVDETGSLIYANDAAKAIFPGLEAVRPDDAINNIQAICAAENNVFRGGNVYSVTSHHIMDKDEQCGVMYMIKNITDSYNYTERLHRDVEEKTKAIKSIQHSVIESFAGLVEARDGETGMHIKRTSAYVEIVAKALMNTEKYKNILDEDTVSAMVEAAPLHDIGKISVPDAILTKPGRLTPEEFEIIKTHSANGAKIIGETMSGVENNEYLSVAQEMAHYHHEKWDGSGYPEGLKGQEIPLSARIMAIADVYDALRSKRTYKESFSKEKAIAIILEGSGQHFDPDIVEVFTENIVEIEAQA